MAPWSRHDRDRKRVVKWTAEMLGYTPDAGGVMVSGGSAATLTGLTVARNVFFREHKINQQGLFGRKPFTLYRSTGRPTIKHRQSVAPFGIGTDNLRRIPASGRFQNGYPRIAAQIEKDLMTATCHHRRQRGYKLIPERIDDLTPVAGR